jgi:hypothetical protein
LGWNSVGHRKAGGQQGENGEHHGDDSKTTWSDFHIPSHSRTFVLPDDGRISPCTTGWKPYGVTSKVCEMPRPLRGVMRYEIGVVNTHSRYPARSHPRTEGAN